MTATKPPRENLLVNLLASFVIPTLILTKASGAERLGPVWGLVVALAFPIGYGIWDFAKRRKSNFIAIIGFVSVLISGSMGLLKADGFWFAVKDATIPVIIGLAVLVTSRTRQPLLKTMFMNEQLMATDKIEAALDERGTRVEFEALIRRISLGLAGSFLVSSVINYFVARAILVSPPGTEAFNQELGKMHWLGALIILVPNLIMMMALLWRLFVGIERLTGLKQDDILATNE